jgi:hypothetical protein
MIFFIVSWQFLVLMVLFLIVLVLIVLVLMVITPCRSGLLTAKNDRAEGRRSYSYFFAVFVASGVYQRVGWAEARSPTFSICQQSAVGLRASA